MKDHGFGKVRLLLRARDIDHGDVALCWAPDPKKGGLPHAMEGMVTVFDGGGVSTPAA